MAELLINDDVLYLKEIVKDDFERLVALYNSEDDFKFATGIDFPITIRSIYDKYIEVFLSKEEFYLGIYLKEDEKFIGAIRVGVNSKVKNALWIYSIAIDKNYRNNGYGTSTVNLTVEYFETNYKINKVIISVLEANQKAKKFWKKIGFNILRKMEGSIRLNNKKQKVIIMQKVLNKESIIC